MKQLKMQRFSNDITLSQLCDMYLHDCQARNLRNATIQTYKERFHVFSKYFDMDTSISKFSEQTYDQYIVHLRNTMDCDISIASYTSTLRAILHFAMKKGYIAPFQMRTIKTDQTSIEIYTDNELQKLLQKPNIKRCHFVEYQCWVMSNLLFSTGIRRNSLVNIRVHDIDFDNKVLHINITKNRRSLIIPLVHTMLSILQEFLKYRQHKDVSDWLFCNAYGNQLVHSTINSMLSKYNKSRGVEKTGLHRYRHTFATLWILNGGNVVTLSRILGHSNLNITQTYVNMLTTDVSKQIDELNLLDKYTHRHIKLNKPD